MYVIEIYKCKINIDEKSIFFNNLYEILYTK